MMIVGAVVTDPEALTQMAIGLGEVAIDVPPVLAARGGHMMDELALGDYLDQAQHELFRLEVLDAYEVATDGNDFGRYLRGEPGPDPARKGPWLQRLAADAARGFRNYRVHVLTSPLERLPPVRVRVGNLPDAAAGEDIRILDLAEKPRPDGLISEDFLLRTTRLLS